MFISVRSKIYTNHIFSGLLSETLSQDSGNVDKKPMKIKKEGEIKKEDEGKTRVLVGVMRVGLLAKQLLLK